MSKHLTILTQIFFWSVNEVATTGVGIGPAVMTLLDPEKPRSPPHAKARQTTEREARVRDHAGLLSANVGVAT